MSTASNPLPLPALPLLVGAAGTCEKSSSLLPQFAPQQRLERSVRPWKAILLVLVVCVGGFYRFTPAGSSLGAALDQFDSPRVSPDQLSPSSLRPLSPASSQRAREKHFLSVPSAESARAASHA